jgi:hypothetical protein
MAMTVISKYSEFAKGSVFPLNVTKIPTNAQQYFDVV